MVAISELACTGQVYLHTIAYKVCCGRALRDYAYIRDDLQPRFHLLAVLALRFAGLSLKSLTAVLQKRIGSVKLAVAGLFVGPAVLTMVKWGLRKMQGDLVTVSTRRRRCTRLRRHGSHTRSVAEPPAGSTRECAVLTGLGEQDSVWGARGA